MGRLLSLLWCPARVLGGVVAPGALLAPAEAPPIAAGFGQVRGFELP